MNIHSKASTLSFHVYQTEFQAADDKSESLRYSKPAVAPSSSGTSSLSKTRAKLSFDSTSATTPVKKAKQSSMTVSEPPARPSKRPKSASQVHAEEDTQIDAEFGKT
jgi:hypothetical protein